MASFHNNSILFTVLVSLSLSVSLSHYLYYPYPYPYLSPSHSHSHSNATRDSITPTQPLADNETLVSAGGTFALGFFSPNDSDRRYIGIWLNNNNNNRIQQNILLLWVANRDSPIIGSTGQLSVTASGTITITNQNSTAVWSTVVTSFTGVSNPVVQLLDTGNFVVKEEGDNNQGYYLWQSFDYPTDTLLPGMKLGVDKATGLSRNLTAWKSDDDPSPGEYYAAMVIGDNSPPEMYLFAGSRKEWRSGPWDGIQLGVLKNWNSSVLNYNFVNNYKEVTFSYQASGQTILPLLQVTNSGKISMEEEGKLLWEVPTDPAINPCDKIGWCGSNAICDSTKTHKCRCLQGFTPKNPANWESIEYSDGCVREVEFDCRKGTDTFPPVKGVKLPESSVSLVNATSNLDACRAECLKNCSCAAYAFISGGGGGCLIWVSDLSDVVQLYMQLDARQDQDLYVQPDAVQDLYIRNGSPDRGSHSLSPKAILAIIVSLISVALLLSCFVFFLWRRKKRERVTLGRTIFFSDKLDEDDGRKDLDLPLFNFGTIAAATESFSDENKLGQGGFGPVYKGTLGGDKEIAVKRLAKSSHQGAEEFKNEVMLIAKLQHRNLVRLLGCCIQGEERMLIYEYMPNKSLDAFLFEKEKAALLEWQTRYQIIVGITRGLLYLHHDSRYRIIHRDLKASNILLDKEMNPKISDFGMARLFGGDATDYNTRKVVGTYGYMSPEYAMEGTFSLKSDVYSFGVLLLEIISGKENRGSYAFSQHLNVVAHAWSLWNEGKSLELVDEAMNNNFPSNDVLKCIKIGLLCVQDHPKDRPLMSSVIEMLGADITSLRHPKQPGFLARMDSDFAQVSSSKDSRMSNELSLTLDSR